MGSQKTFVTDTIAQNLSGKLIPTQRFSVYIFDKKQVRIGEAWMQVDNLRAKPVSQVPNIVQRIRSACNNHCSCPIRYSKNSL